MSRINLDAFKELEEKKLVTRQKHPEFDLLIFNYTPVCQFQSAWDEHTLMARGLITDLDGSIVARPFRKFFNLSEHHGADSKLPPIDWGLAFNVCEKMDGSLGILYPTPAGHRFATRGSFTSHQSQKALEIWQRKYAAHAPLLPGYTYLFEIIFPQNRIVVEYGEMEDLVLLDLVRISDGYSPPWKMVEQQAAHAIGCPHARRFTELEEKEMLEAFVADPSNGKNSEGFVLRFEDGSRVKVKLEEYVRLHRLLTGLTARHIWENLAAGEPLEKLADKVPDEFNVWLKHTAGEITANFQDYRHRAVDAFFNVKRGISHDATRKDYAMEFQKHGDLTPLLWGLFDGKDISHLIWKRIRPESTKAFRCGEA